MAELADGFLCLPGGPGTFEEVFQQWTWALLGFHSKPCGFVNVDGYYGPLRAAVANMVENGFLQPRSGEMLIWARDTEEALARFEACTVPPPPKWNVSPSRAAILRAFRATSAPASAPIFGRGPTRS